jgi:hypothetical protein
VWFGKLGKITKLFLLLFAGSSFHERLFDRSASTPNAGELEELEYIVVTLVWDHFIYASSSYEYSLMEQKGVVWFHFFSNTTTNT